MYDAFAEFQEVRAPPVRARGRRIFASAVLCIAAISGLICFTLYDSYLSTRDLAVQSAQSVGALVDQDISRNFELLKLSLQAVVDAEANPRVMALDPTLRQLTLFDRSDTAQGLGAILVMNEKGDLVLDSRTTQPVKANFADKDYFQVQQVSDDLGFYVSKPFKGKLCNGQWVIGVSHRLSHDDGSFAGVVVGIIHLSYFEQVLQRANLAESSSMTLMDGHGFLLARYPSLPSLIGQPVFASKISDILADASDEKSVDVGGLDGISRLYTTREVHGAPLIVSVGVSTQALFADWDLRAVMIALSLVALSAVILIFANRVYQELRQRLRYEERLEALVRTDKLTGIANRREFDDRLSFEFARAKRNGSAACLLMIDIDFFKSYNDRFGHQVGDATLAAVAKTLQSKLKRASDLVARYGGEEFAVLLPDTEKAGAANLAEQMRKAVAALRIDGTRGSQVTVSIGAAWAYPRAAMSSSHLLAQTDEALYVAKASGRNRVCWSTGEADPLKLSA